MRQYNPIILSLIYLLMTTVRSEAQMECATCPSLQGQTIVCGGGKGTRCAATVKGCTLEILKNPLSETPTVDPAPLSVMPSISKTTGQKYCTYLLKEPKKPLNLHLKKLGE